MSWRQSFVHWSATDVARWLSRNGLGEYSSKFIEEEVSGRSLLGLTPALLAALIPKIGPQAEFNYILNELKRCENSGDHPIGRSPNRLEQLTLRSGQRSTISQSVSLEIPEIPHSNESQVSASDDTTTEDDVTSPQHSNTLPGESSTSPASQMSANVSVGQQPSTSSNPTTSSIPETLKYGLGEMMSSEDQMRFLLLEIPERLMRRLDQPESVLPYSLQIGRSSEKNQLVRCVYEQLQKITLYPSALQYRQAGRAIVTRFPHLRDDSKTGFEHWAKTLKERFKNQRRWMTDIPAVMERKQYRQRQFERTFGDLAGDSLAKARRVEEPEEIEDLKLFYEPHGSLNVQQPVELDLDVEPGDEDVEEKSNQ